MVWVRMPPSSSFYWNADSLADKLERIRRMRRRVFVGRGVSLSLMPVGQYVKLSPASALCLSAFHHDNDGFTLWNCKSPIKCLIRIHSSRTKTSCLKVNLYTQVNRTMCRTRIGRRIIHGDEILNRIVWFCVSCP